MVQFGDGGRDRMGVQVSQGRRMSQTNDVAFLEEPERGIGIIGRFVPPRQNKPVVIIVLVVVTSDLLLERANGEGLDV